MAGEEKPDEQADGGRLAVLRRQTTNLHKNLDKALAKDDATLAAFLAKARAIKKELEETDGEPTDDKEYKEKIARCCQAATEEIVARALLRTASKDDNMSATPADELGAEMSPTVVSQEQADRKDEMDVHRLLREATEELARVRREKTAKPRQRAASESTDPGRPTRSGRASSAYAAASSRWAQIDEAEMSGSTSDDSPRRPRRKDRHRSYEALVRAGLSKFEGKFEDWPSYWQNFKVEVHDNRRLSDREKMQLLMATTAYHVNRMIAGFNVDGRDYQASVELLYDTYSRPEMARAAIIADLKDKTRIQEYDSSALLKFIAEARTASRALSTLDLPDRTHENEFSKAVYNAMPDSIRFFLRYGKDRTPEGVLSVLTEHLGFFEKNAVSFGLVRAPARPVAAEPPAAWRKRSVATVNATPAEAVQCPFCGEDGHTPESCTKFATSKARRMVVVNRWLCWICLERHKTATCERERPECGCERAHHASLCEAMERERRTQKASANAVAARPEWLDEHDVPIVFVHSVSRPSADGDRSGTNRWTVQGRTSLMTMLVDAVGEQSRQPIRVLLDSGAHVCLVSRRLVDSLGLVCTSVPPVRLMLAANQVGPRVDRVAEVPLGKRGQPAAGVLEAYVVEEATEPAEHALTERVRAVAKERGIQLDDCTSHEEAKRTPIELLVGMDTLNRLRTWQSVDLGDGMRAHETEVGWCVGGTDSRGSPGRRQAVLFVRRMAGDADELDECEERVLTREQEAEQSDLIDLVERSLEMRERRYWVGLPWLQRNGIDSNMRSAAQRLRRLVERLHATGQYEAYEAELLQLVKDGHAERVDLAQEVAAYYMPHRGIERPGAATTKLRVVFDASSHASGREPLNGLLAKGVDLNPSVTGLVTKFRVGSVAAVSDLQKAFLQVRIHEADRDFLRFLWLGRRGNLEAYRMTSVPFGATCSPFLLAVVIRHHLTKEAEEHPTVRQLLGRIYVDDALITTDTVEQMGDLHSESVQAFARCSMSLHKWRCSNSQLDRQWAGEEADAETKVLGLMWAPAADRLRIKVPVVEYTVCTRRLIQSQLGSLYDPLGLCTPAVVPLKLLVREILRDGVGWDDSVEGEVAKRFQAIMKTLPRLEEASVPRQIAAAPEEIGLALYCDASGKAIGAVVYAVHLPGGRRPVLVASRSKLAGDRTIPELELQAAGLGSELLEHAGRATGCWSWRCYSDSSTALAWIKAHPNKLKRPFITNRVRQLRRSTSLDQWNHVQGTRNPADMLSRGVSAAVLLSSLIWWHGPEELAALRPEDFSRRDASVKMLAVTRGIAQEDGEPVVWQDLWDRIESEVGGGSKDPPPGDQVLREIWKREQQAAFGEEMAQVQRGKVAAGNSLLRQFVPFVDDHGLMRARTRLRTGDPDFDSPLILDGGRPTVRAWIRHVHEVSYHLGDAALRAQVREHHVVLGLRGAVRRVLSTCLQCVRQHGRPIKQPAGLLPKERLNGGEAFTAIGIDFFGPLLLPGGGKRNVLLATCMASRAVHLELLPGQKAGDVWTGLRRLFARRGVPAVVFSDNGKGFVRTEKEIRMIREGLAQAQALAVPTIKWKFSSASAPWQGGVFERMVGLAKSHLPTAAAGVALPEKELSTVVIEVEAILNSRPIGLLPSGEALTPGHLCIGRRPTSWPGLDGPMPAKTKNLVALAAKRNQLLDNFWNAWRRSYLGGLPGRFADGGRVRTVKVGDCVVVYEADAKRCEWPVGRVTRVFPGPDSVVRNVEVEIGGKSYARPVQRLTLIGEELEGAV